MTVIPNDIQEAQGQNSRKVVDGESNMSELINQLKRGIAEEHLIQCPPEDEFYARFVRGRKYNVERAIQSLTRYINMRIQNDDLINTLHPKAFENFYNEKAVVVYKNRDSKGRQILHLRTDRWNPDKIDLIPALFSALLVVEEMIFSSLETQHNGITVIFDLKGLSFSQARQATPKVIRLLIDIVQGTLPVSFNEIHFINHPYLFNMLYAIGKPFLTNKMRKRLVFHAFDMKSLHKHLSRDILPKSLKGKLTDEEAWDDTIIENLYKRDDYYKEYLSKLNIL